MVSEQPSAVERLAFLTNFERLLVEGSFVATYKYALMVALTELAVERGHDHDAVLVISIGDLAEKFIELYWRQSAPFGYAIADNGGGILVQSTGQQASIVQHITALRLKYSTLPQARASDVWQGCVTQVVKLIKEMPLWRLQRLRQGSLEFLYRKGHDGKSIELLPGVSANLRYLHGFILRMVQSEWLRFVQRLPANQQMLGPSSDLSEFLFGADRAALGRARDGLRELQGSRCFYCETALTERADIDHFIPWSRYPRDLVHNLVIAHPTCNGNKSDLLAGEVFRGRWLQWTSSHDRDLEEIGFRAGLLVDRLTAINVAEWSYSHAKELGAEVWMGGREYAPIA